MGGRWGIRGIEGGLGQGASMIHLYCGAFCEYGSDYMQSMGVGGDGGTWVIRLVSLG